jgi:hypothetical protein
MAQVPYSPKQVIPPSLSDEVEDLPHWFVIGGHAVRCLCPYRPSVDVDFGVGDARGMSELLDRLAASGQLELLERSDTTVHARWNGINVSVFVLDKLAPYTEERRLTVTGILATKLHAVLDRGTRRDLFDLYVALNHQRLGIFAAIRALRDVYETDVDEGLLLRAMTYFDDAEREAPLPGEGPSDWERLKTFFQQRVGSLLTPPSTELAIQRNVVDVRHK